MFACVVYWCDHSKKVIPIEWIYKDPSKILRRKSYLAFFFPNIKKKAPPITKLKRNHGMKLVIEQVHTVFVYDLVEKFTDGHQFLKTPVKLPVKKHISDSDDVPEDEEISDKDVEMKMTYIPQRRITRRSTIKPDGDDVPTSNHNPKPESEKANDEHVIMKMPYVPQRRITRRSTILHDVPIQNPLPVGEIKKYNSSKRRSQRFNQKDESNDDNGSQKRRSQRFNQSDKKIRLRTLSTENLLPVINKPPLALKTNQKGTIDSYNRSHSKFSDKEIEKNTEPSTNSRNEKNLKKQVATVEPLQTTPIIEQILLPIDPLHFLPNDHPKEEFIIDDEITEALEIDSSSDDPYHETQAYINESYKHDHDYLATTFERDNVSTKSSSKVLIPQDSDSELDFLDEKIMDDNLSSDDQEFQDLLRRKSVAKTTASSSNGKRNSLPHEEYIYTIEDYTNDQKKTIIDESETPELSSVSISLSDNDEDDDDLMNDELAQRTIIIDDLRFRLKRSNNKVRKLNRRVRELEVELNTLKKSSATPKQGIRVKSISELQSTNPSSAMQMVSTKTSPHSYAKYQPREIPRAVSKLYVDHLSITGFTQDLNVPEITVARLDMLNLETGSGSYSDTLFAQRLAVSIWGRDILARRSVSGSRANIWPGLERTKLKFIYEKVYERARIEGDNREKAIDRARISKINCAIGTKIQNLRKSLNINSQPETVVNAIKAEKKAKPVISEKMLVRSVVEDKVAISAKKVAFMKELSKISIGKSSVPNNTTTKAMKFEEKFSKNYPAKFPRIQNVYYAAKASEVDDNLPGSQLVKRVLIDFDDDDYDSD